jgi:hypothetical protein
VDREDLKDALDEAPQGAGLGEITGGGTGLGPQGPGELGDDEGVVRDQHGGVR